MTLNASFASDPVTFTTALAHVDMASVHQMNDHILRSSSDSGPRSNGDHTSFLMDKNGSPDIKIEETSTDLSRAGQKLLPLRSIVIEITALVLALASLLGLVAILFVYNGKPNPEWSMAHIGSITLNTIISIISTVFRATLLVPVAQSISQSCWVWFKRPRPLQDVVYYDFASRGPYGSLQLLSRIRFK